MIHTCPFVLACLLAKMNRERVSKQTDTFSILFFLPIMYVCTHALLFFLLLLLFDDQCIRDIVFRACSHCRRQFISISIIPLRTREKKRMSSKLSGGRAGGRTSECVRIWITTPFLFLFLCAFIIRSRRIREKKREEIREEYNTSRPIKVYRSIS